MEDEVVDVGIRSTTNYDKFKIHPYGRKISKKHVNRLVDSISRENHLDSSPILVNLNFEIICGQHRLMAAKKLGVPIYYVVRDMSECYMRQQMGHSPIPSIYHDDWQGPFEEDEEVS